MRLRSFGFLAALALAVPAAAQTPEIPPFTVGPPTVKVLSTGTGAKRPIRYKAAAGSRERVAMRMDASAVVDAPGAGQQTMDIPTLTLTIDTEVKGVTSAGDISVRVAIVGVETGAPGFPPGMLDGFKNVAIDMVFNSRGIVSKMNLADAQANPLVQQLLASSGLDRLSIPMPEEPLGVGARFEVTNTVESQGMKLDQTSTFEVVAMDERSVTLQTTLRQEGKPQAVSMAGLPDGATINLISMESTGTGRMTIVDGSIMPVGSVDMSTDMVMELGAQGQIQRMKSGMKMKMTVTKDR